MSKTCQEYLCVTPCGNLWKTSPELRLSEPRRGDPASPAFTADGRSPSRLRRPAAPAQAIRKTPTGRRGRPKPKMTKSDHRMLLETEAWEGLKKKANATTSFLPLKDDQQEGRQRRCGGRIVKKESRYGCGDNAR